MRLNGKSAVVTGAGRGLGEAIAIRLSEEGATVVVNDMDIEAAQQVAKKILDLGGRAIAKKADLTKSAEVNVMIKEACDEIGAVDILVNCAGGSARGKASLFHESSEEVWDQVIDRNLKSAMICTRAVINGMIARGSGRIVNFSGGTALTGEVGLVDYCAAKAGILGFTKALAREVGALGINVNCVTPGIIETRAIQQVPADVAESLRKRIVLGRMGEPRELADTVLFLVSDDSRYITGQNHIVCGGAYIGW